MIGPPPDYHAYTNDNFFRFVVTTPFSDPPTPPIHKRLESWLGHPGSWVAVAQHAWDNYVNSEMLYDELSGFIGAAQGVGWPVIPPPTQNPDNYNWDAYALTFGASNPQGNVDWQAFRNALYDPYSRNLVYFGHGGPYGLGQNPADTNRFITSAEIGNMLHTIPAGQTNSHSFRFVFIDGCSTAKGNLPEAFGMFHRENVPGSDYGLAFMRYSAFVGWSSDKRIGIGLGNGQINLDHVSFIVLIQQQMIQGWTIIDAVNYAANQCNFSAMTVYGFWGETLGLDNY